jgi:hypothetical protein
VGAHTVCTAKVAKVVFGSSVVFTWRATAFDRNGKGFTLTATDAVATARLGVITTAVPFFVPSPVVSLLYIWYREVAPDGRFSAVTSPWGRIV